LDARHVTDVTENALHKGWTLNTKLRYCAASTNALASTLTEEDLALKSMPIGKLVEMRNRIDAILASKVADQRRILQSELSKLARFQPNRLALDLAVWLLPNIVIPTIQQKPGLAED
jgi:hypothetical protein